VNLPFAGLGLHVFIAIFFAIHAVRTGQQMYWLLILFLFPLLGSVVYFFAIFLPRFRLHQGARRAITAAAKAINPQGEMREAQAAFEELPTAQNQMRLAEAQFELGLYEEAAKNYEACLKGPFSTSLEIRFGAARAFVESGRYDEALTHLEAIQKIDQGFRLEAVTLLLARSYAAVGKAAEARSMFEWAVERYGTFEARAQYAIWALSIGDTATAAKLQGEIDHIKARWSPQTRELNATTLQRLDAARKKFAPK
jgi:hypothetical protein